MDRRERRLAENEAFFRRLNEGTQSFAERLGPEDQHLYAFVCECSNRDCDRTVEARCSDYKRIRESKTRFIVAPGHALEEIERVVERTPRYDVVEKEGEAARYVAEMRD